MNLESKVTKSDHDALIAHIEAINKILDPYPYKKIQDSHFITMMSRCKTSALTLQGFIKCLPIREGV